MKTVALAAMALTICANGVLAADIDICVEGAYPPFSETTATGEVVGFDIDIAKALCAEMGKSCTLVKTEWDAIIPSLVEGKCDAIIASMSITEDRKTQIDFSTKYQNSPAKFASADGAGFEDTPEGMAGKIVGVQRGTIHQDYMEAVYPDADLTLYATQDEAYLDLQSGRLDAIMADSIAMSEGFLKTENGAGFSFFGGDHAVPEYHGEGAGVGVRKEDAELRDAFSAAISAIRADGTYKAINDTYFDVDIFGG